MKNSYFINSNFRKISKNLILNVIKARLDEIIDRSNKHMIVPGFNSTSAIHFIFHGGSNLTGIDEYFANFFGSGLKNVDKDTNKNLEENFISCLGAIKIIKDGWETEAIPEIGDKTIEKAGFLAKFFKIGR